MNVVRRNRLIHKCEMPAARQSRCPDPRTASAKMQVILSEVKYGGSGELVGPEAGEVHHRERNERLAERSRGSEDTTIRGHDDKY
jgi:hypothetical protein